MMNDGRSAPCRAAALRSAPSASFVPSERYLWTVVGAGLLVQTGASLGHQALAPLAPFLTSDLGLSRAAFGLLASPVYLGATVANVPAGRFCDRLGVRPLFLLGPAVVGTALVAGAVLGSYAGLLALLLVSGLGNALALPPTTRAIVDWIPARRRALPMSIKQTGVALAGTLTALVVPPLALAYDWRGALGAVGVATAVAGLVAFLAYRERPAEPDVPGRPIAGMRHLLANRNLMLVCGATLLLAAVQLSVVSFLVLFLGDRLHYPVEAAASLLALAQLSGVVGRIGWGVVSDRLFAGRRRPALAAIALLAALGMLGLSLADATTPAPLLAGLIVLIGGSAIGWNGVSMTFVAELAGRRQAASAAGLNLTSSGVGILIAPPLFGALVDATGSYALGFQALAAVALGVLLLVQAIRPQRSAED